MWARNLLNIRDEAGPGQVTRTLNVWEQGVASLYSIFACAGQITPKRPFLWGPQGHCHVYAPVTICAVPVQTEINRSQRNISNNTARKTNVHFAHAKASFTVSSSASISENGAETAAAAGAEAAASTGCSGCEVRRAKRMGPTWVLRKKR